MNIEKQLTTRCQANSGDYKVSKASCSKFLTTFLLMWKFTKHRTKMSAERKYQCFFQICNEYEENRQQQGKFLKPNYLESFDADTERRMGEKKKTLKWLVEQTPKFGEIAQYGSYVSNYGKMTLRVYTKKTNCRSLFWRCEKIGRGVMIRNSRRYPQASIV